MTLPTVLEGLYINGQWSCGEQYLRVINPATEALLTTVHGGDERAVDRALDAATQAFGPWSKTTGGERGAILRRIAAGVQAGREQLMQLQSRNNGKPLFEAAIDVDDVVATFEYYAELAEGLDTRQDSALALPSDDFSARLRREPCGVVGLIVPWNFPMVTTAWKLAPALAAGCCVVLKPSEVTPLSELELASIIADCGLPDGVFNLICGTGLAVGAPLAADPRVAKISFTGSNAVGVQVMQRAAETVKGVSLELGGKSSLLVLADADLELAVELACGGGFFNAGQMCSATSRVLVADELADEFLQRLKIRAEAIRVTDPFDPDVEMGALVNQAQYQRVLGHIDRGLSAGATLVCGGQRPTHLSRGFFLQPTIFTDVPRTVRCGARRFLDRCCACAVSAAWNRRLRLPMTAVSAWWPASSAVISTLPSRSPTLCRRAWCGSTRPR